MIKVEKEKLYIVMASTMVAFISMNLFSAISFQTDSPTYTYAISVLTGEVQLPEMHYRLAKPLSFIFPALLCYILKIGPAEALIVQQFICNISIGLLMYSIIKKMHSRKEAILGIIILMGCQPFAIYSLAVMIDGAGWAIELFIIYYYLKIRDYNRFKDFITIGILLSLGIFIKETILISGLLIAVDRLLNKWKFIHNLKNLMVVGVVFLIIFLSGTILTDKLFGNSLFSWWNISHSDKSICELNIYHYLQQTFRTLDLFWIPFLIGSVLLIFNIKKTKLDFELTLLIVGSIALIIFPIFWCYKIDRIIFMISILFIPTCARGLGFYGKGGLFLATTGALLNISLTYRIYFFRESGWILGLSLFYTVLLTFLLIRKIYLSKSDKQSKKDYC